MVVPRAIGLSGPVSPAPARHSNHAHFGGDDDLRARVIAERLEQGLPALIADLTVLHRLALAFVTRPRALWPRIAR